MKFYFAWAQADENFDPARHLIEDEKIIVFNIHHNEGEFPYAHVRLCHKKGFLKPGEKAFISCDGDEGPELLFAGFLLSVPNNILAETLDLEFIAEPLDSVTILKEQCQGLKALPKFDPLFCRHQDQDNLEEVLDGQTCLPHWDRCMQGAKFSDIHEGRRIKDIGHHFIYDSLNVRLTTPPLDHITCSVTAEWIQKYQGVVDAGFGIKECLDGGRIKTLTPEKIMRQWWQPGTVAVGGTYQVLSAHLKNYQIVGQSPPFEIYGQESRETLPVYGLEPHLTLSYHIHQKRKETVHFKINNNCQVLSKPQQHRHHKHLTFNLEDITYDNQRTFWESNQDYKAGDKVFYQGAYYVCHKDHQAASYFSPYHWNLTFHSNSPLGDLAQASYFLTPRGQQSLESAMERCVSYLASSARAVETRFKIPFQAGMDIDCDTTVMLQDPRLPNERLAGKVVHYKMAVSGAGAPYVEVTLLSSVGGQEGATAPSDFTTPSGIGYRDYKDQTPTQGMIDVKDIPGVRVVEFAKPHNMAEKQGEVLRDRKFMGKRSALKRVESFPVPFKLKLADLNTEVDWIVWTRKRHFIG